MHESLPTRLRVLRAERGLTLRDAEELTGVDKDTLSKIERGLRQPHDVTLAKIARGYGIGVEDLLEEPALAGTAPKAEAPDTGQEESPDPIFDMIHRLALEDLAEEEKAGSRAYYSERPQSYFVKGHNEAVPWLLKQRHEETVGSYVELMEGFVRLEQRVEQLEQENERLKQGHVPLERDNERLSRELARLFEGDPAGRSSASETREAPPHE